MLGGQHPPTCITPRRSSRSWPWPRPAAPPMDDPRVRRALAHAIDRRAFVRRCWPGWAHPPRAAWSPGACPATSTGSPSRTTPPRQHGCWMKGRQTGPSWWPARPGAWLDPSWPRASPRWVSTCTVEVVDPADLNEVGAHVRLVAGSPTTRIRTRSCGCAWIRTGRPSGSRRNTVACWTRLHARPTRPTGCRCTPRWSGCWLIRPSPSRLPTRTGTCS
jgi:hypothetical protein